MDLDADARRFKIETGDLVKVRTRIGYFVTRAWVTEGIRPGVLAMSHHLGRGGSMKIRRRRRSSSLVSSRMKTAAADEKVHGAKASGRIPTRDASGGARSACIRTMTFPVQPDPSAACTAGTSACTSKGRPDDAYGDIMVDTDAAHQAYRIGWTRRGPHQGRRAASMWFDRPLRPVASAYKVSPE